MITDEQIAIAEGKQFDVDVATAFKMMNRVDFGKSFDKLCKGGLEHGKVFPPLVLHGDMANQFNAGQEDDDYDPEEKYYNGHTVYQERNKDQDDDRESD